jgi:hypothetical protein
MLVFVHINKTAGRTVRYILRSTYGARHCDVEPLHARSNATPFSTPDLRRVRKLYPSLASIAGHRISGYVDLVEPGTEFRYFTVLREPVKLCASRFQYHVDYRGKKDLVFEDWIQQEWLRNAQTTRIAGTPSAAAAIDVIERKQMFVGVSERFDESMVLLKALRAEDLDIAHTPVNVARRNTIADALLADPKSRDALVEANGADLELYEYVTTDLYPRLCREYGPSLEDAVTSFRNDPRRSFNRRNLTVARLKQHGLLRPAGFLYRSRATGKAMERLLG